MKTINYTGSSKLIARIVNLLNRKVPLPLDGDGDPDWGTNGQVLSTDGSGNTAWVNHGGGGSGGHTIWGRLKATLTQRSRLWFADANASDASADDATKVEVVTELASESAFDNLATDGTADGIYAFPDSGGEYLTAEMVGYENTNVKAALDGKVSKSGDTMTGALSVTSSSTATPLSVKGSSANTTYLSLLNSSGTELGKFGANGGHPIWQYGGTNTNIATWSDLFMNRATPFYLQGNSKDQLKFTFTGLSALGSIHLFIFALTCSGEVLAACSSSGFSSVKRTLLTDGDTYHLGLTYALNNGYTFNVQVGAWSSVWGIFVHTDYPNAAMTMEWVS